METFDDLPPLDGPESALIWLRFTAKQVYEGNMDVRESKEIRSLLRQYIDVWESQQAASKIKALKDEIEELRGDISEKSDSAPWDDDPNSW